MKTRISNIVLFLLLFFSMSPAFSEDFATRALIDKTYVRDNSYCNLNGKKFEIEIRSLDQYSSPQDAELGEHAFFVQNDKRTLLPLNNDLLGRYRFLKGDGKECTKSLVLKLDDSRIVLFFLKASRPLQDTLDAVIYNPSTGQGSVVETSFGIVKARVQNNLLHFGTATFLHPMEVGNVKVFGKDFVFKRKELARWYIYDGKSFSLNLENTFKNFELKDFFQDSAEFAKAFSWQDLHKKFTIQHYSYAIRHQSKERCFSVDPTNALWRCK